MLHATTITTSTWQSSTIRIDVSEDNVAVQAHDVRFEVLVNAINGATGVYRWDYRTGCAATERERPGAPGAEV